jgi:hypothetical protein
MSEPFIFSRSGRKLYRHNFYPPILDAAWQLSRIPRFAGALESTWSVLQHQLFVHAIAQQAGHSDEDKFYALTHDLHEMVTGDIPTPFKTPDIIELQKDLDASFFGHIGFIPKRETVKLIDGRCMQAEAEMLLLPEVVGDMADEIGGAESGYKEALVQLQSKFINSYTPRAMWRGMIKYYVNKLHLRWE